MAAKPSWRDARLWTLHSGVLSEVPPGDRVAAFRAWRTDPRALRRYFVSVETRSADGRARASVLSPHDLDWTGFVSSDEEG